MEEFSDGLVEVGDGHFCERGLVDGYSEGVQFFTRVEGDSTAAGGRVGAERAEGVVPELPLPRDLLTFSPKVPGVDVKAGEERCDEPGDLLTVDIAGGDQR